MNTLHAPDITDRFTTQLVRRTAQTLVDEGTYPSSDLEDVAQELTLALFEQAENFDPDRARWSTFVKTVVKLVAISLRRRQRAECRQVPIDIVSINILISDDDGQPAELGATVSEEEHRTGVGQDTVDHTDQVDLTLDVQSLLATLPDELREICTRLKEHSPSEVAIHMGISRNTLARRMEELRKHFRAAGFDPPR